MRSAFVFGVAAATLALCSAQESRAINVNFNSCSGETKTGRCGITKFIRYVEGEFPPFDDVNPVDDSLEGLAKELFTHICDTSVFKNAGIECVSILDAWSVIWTKDHHPGPALRSGWYHMALAFVNSLRKQSHVFSYPLSTRPKNQLVSLDANQKTGVTFPDKGAGLRMCVISTWGDKQAIMKAFDAATFVEVENEAAQVSALSASCESPASEPCCDVMITGSITATNLLVSEDPKYKIVSSSDGEALEIVKEGDPKHQDEVAFMFSKVDVCLRDLVNEAMEELRMNKGEQIRNLFGEHVDIIKPLIEKWMKQA